MHDKMEHHQHEGETSGGAVSEIARLRTMAEHWIGHNEEHARSYRLWAKRAREAGREGAGAILEGIAEQTLRQNGEFKRMLHLLDDAGA